MVSVPDILTEAMRVHLRVNLAMALGILDWSAIVDIFSKHVLDISMISLKESKVDEVTETIAMHQGKRL